MLKDLSIKTRLFTIVGVAVLGQILVCWLVLSGLKQSILEEKRLSTLYLSQVAVAVVNNYHSKVASGELDEAKAKQLALAELKSIRYKENDYYFVIDQQVTMLMHPFRPDLDGKDVADFKDKQGEPLFQNMADGVVDDGSHSVFYNWPKPGTTEEVPKVSHVELFKPWGWIVGTGIYIDDVEASFYEVAIQLAVLVLFVVGLMLALSWYVTRSVVKPMTDVVAAMQDIASGDGDLTVKLSYDGKDELAALATAFNLFVGKIRQLITSVGVTSVEVSESALDVARISQQISKESVQQQQETDMVATAITQMSSAIAEVAQSAEQANHETGQVETLVQQGMKLMKASVQSIHTQSQTIEQSSVVASSLYSSSQNISHVLNIINKLADQTNLLALNAAIEAARAGEHGRGFSVVADEVRTLAHQTQKSTQEISGIIAELQQGTQQMTAAVQESKTAAELNINLAAQVQQALTDIANSIAQISDMNAHIATAAEQQSAVAGEVDQNVHTISQLVHQTAGAIKGSDQSTQRLTQLSQDLKDLVKQFKV
ncbi:methyl-accepting chemotaxis protein [Rheinheimera tangshanensis]|uniref:Methyl-accepting chemotaxis protein n=1 Tax=Rheinheimera tangshanensis TaxID=400153 RepID=A0A5C8M0A1_9GAMM|nr:methyl-accepting chemotaxis protein [Rheinheimera tangshanensis]GGM60088.1 methyl-accepting chemotaxis protein [Rheinheimera tangshanensis]